jgi:hypothetical protein
MHSHNRALRTFAALCHAQASEIILSSRAEHESAQRTRSAPQARSGRPARILQRFCRRMRRSSTTVEVWPPSPSRGAPSFFLRHRRCPPSSSLRNRLLRTPKSAKEPWKLPDPKCPKNPIFGPLFGGFTFRDTSERSAAVLVCAAACL